MKYILVIGDGMADNPLAALGGKTPLEYADIPTIDRLSAQGILGSVRNCPVGFQPGSDVAIMSIFGCSPDKYYSGRAPLEAAAQGISLNPGDAAFRCNNVAISEGGDFMDRTILSHSAGGIGGKDAMELVNYLFAHPEFSKLAERAGMRIYPANSYRHIVVMESTDISGLKLIPPHDHINERVGDNLPIGHPVGEVLIEIMARANEILERHPINEERRAEGKLPANSIWFWAEGTAAALPGFKEQYGRSGAVISAVPLCHGIARLIGLDVIHIPGATGELETNYEGKVRGALEALKDHDFVAVHLEGPDECTHNGDLKGKLQAIEWLDSRIVAPLLKGLEDSGEDFRMLILSDHKTLTESLLHDGDPVPFVLYDSRTQKGSGLPYTERNGETGMRLEAGTDLMPLLFEL